MVALPLGFLVAGTLGLAMERTVLARMMNRPLDTLLVTFGLSLILQQAARDLFGWATVARQYEDLYYGSLLSNQSQ